MTRQEGSGEQQHARRTSYVHQRSFALQGGADRVCASLWPLSVDGLLLLATPGLLKQESGAEAGVAVGAGGWLAARGLVAVGGTFAPPDWWSSSGRDRSVA
ncbi:DUF2637 domain-containing protein [Streptomyces sp. NPDC004270]